MKLTAGQLQLEIKTIRAMIGIYCRGHHGRQRDLCPECRQLRDYVCERLKRCPFRDDKPACTDCTIHCYQPARRADVIAIMRYAGPRMPLAHPLLALRHVFYKTRARSKGIPAEIKRKNKKSS